jgi:hypothetical protein
MWPDSSYQWNVPASKGSGDSTFNFIEGGERERMMLQEC